MDYFSHKAKGYEQNPSRVDNVNNIASVMLEKVRFTENDQVVDFGSGTGLLLEKIAPHVKKIIAVDISRSMNEQLNIKKDRIPCEVEIIEKNLELDNLDGEFDGVISSMTMHHVKDVASMFNKFYTMIKPGGFVAIADLDIEDGSFHTEDTGVYHHGFHRDEFVKSAVDAGFGAVSICSASVVKKPQGNYPVFLLYGIR